MKLVFDNKMYDIQVNDLECIITSDENKKESYNFTWNTLRGCLFESAVYERVSFSSNKIVGFIPDLTIDYNSSYDVVLTLKHKNCTLNHTIPLLNFVSDLMKFVLSNADKKRLKLNVLKCIEEGIESLLLSYNAQSSDTYVLLGKCFIYNVQNQIVGIGVATRNELKAISLTNLERFDNVYLEFEHFKISNTLNCKEYQNPLGCYAFAQNFELESKKNEAVSKLTFFDINDPKTYDVIIKTYDFKTVGLAQNKMTLLDF